MSAALRIPGFGPLRLAALLLAPMLGCGTLRAQKKPLAGLVAMGKIPTATMSIPGSLFVNDLAEPKAHPGIYVGVDLNFTWAQIQPANSRELRRVPIDSAIDEIISYNKTHRRKMRAKLHVWAGVNAPPWVLAMDGGPVALKAPSGMFVPHPRFWTTSYHDAWKNLQTLLAAQYDRNPLVAEIGGSSCASRTDEPFVMAHDRESISNLLAVGYTDAQYIACLRHGVTDDYSAWHTTPIDFPFNAFEQVDSGELVPNSYTTIQMLQMFRSTFGTGQGVISNHGLKVPLNSIILSVYNGTATYKGIQQLGPPIEFQTYNQQPTGGWDASVSLARNTYHASEMEIWVTTAAGGSASITTAQLNAWAADDW